MLVEDGLLREKKDGITALSGLVDVEQESFQPEALVMTASQEVEGLSSLVHQFPQVTFHIAALTAMGPKLTDLAARPNVRLYPGISLGNYESLLARCSIYLDCNQGEEVMNSSIRALENGQVLFGLKSTVHQEAYKDLSTITDTVEEMEQQLDTLLQQPETCLLYTSIPGLSAVKPKAGLYIFPKIDRDMYRVDDDEQFVLEFLKQEKILLVHGRGFNWKDPDHFRIVYLPRVDELAQIQEKMTRFLKQYKR